MEFSGFVKGLNGAALKGKTILIPKGTIIRVLNHPIDAIRLVDMHNNTQHGQIQQTVLESWKQNGGPYTSLSGEASALAKDDVKVADAFIFNGSVAHKIIFNATFGEDKTALFEEQGENYVLSNPLVAWKGENDKTVYMVEINDVEEITSGKIEVIKTPSEQAKDDQNGQGQDVASRIGTGKI